MRGRGGNSTLRAEISNACHYYHVIKVGSKCGRFYNMYNILGELMWFFLDLKHMCGGKFDIKATTLVSNKFS